MQRGLQQCYRMHKTADLLGGDTSTSKTPFVERMGKNTAIPRQCRFVRAIMNIPIAIL